MTYLKPIWAFVTSAAILFVFLFQLYLAVQAELVGDYAKAIYEMLWALLFAYLGFNKSKDK
jgi:hypothetical protein